jgi:hypothetical protein
MYYGEWLRGFGGCGCHSLTTTRSNLQLTLSRPTRHSDVCVWHCTTHRSYSNGYLDHHIDEMLALCQAHAIGKVTFAVHGVFAQQDTDRMNRLLAHPGSTVTFWGVADDPVHRWLDSLDPKRTYRDTMPPGWLEWVGLRLFRNLGYVR